MNWIENMRHQAKVAYALNWSRDYPNVLPNPRLEPISILQQERIDRLKSICLFLGPYRNLTTLTASMLFLHPECQVLNHAGSRVLTNLDLNFLSDYSEKKFREFCNFAITMSQGGRRGGYGGSIVLSHAFANHAEMQKRFKRRYGSRLFKRVIKSLVWKESEMIGQYIRNNKVDLRQLVKVNPRLKFLLPIRNPLDCSLSISRIGISRFYPNLRDDQIGDLLDSILEEIHWFLTLSSEFPDHFLYFFQDEVNEKTLNVLGQFLGLSHDQRWIDDSLSVYQLKRSYEYGMEIKSRYLEKVQMLFSRYPVVQSRLKRMALSSD